jgi:hypothetical protein
MHKKTKPKSVLDYIFEKPNRTNRYEIAWQSETHPDRNGVVKFRCTEKKLHETIMVQKLNEIAKKNKLLTIDDIRFRFRRTD